MNPSSANRVDDLYETVRLLHSLKKEGIEDWRVGVALNRLREVSAVQDDKNARAYLAQVGFKALPGFVLDLTVYEVAMLQGKAMTETDESGPNREASAVTNGIAGAVLEARDWEQGRKEPDAAARAFLRVIAREPELVREALEKQSA